MARSTPRRRWTPARRTVFGCLICCFTLARALPVHAANPSWQALPPLPDRFGVAGACAGVSESALIVAGGADFPEDPPWEGGRKAWRADVFVLTDPLAAWLTGHDDLYVETEPDMNQIRLTGLVAAAHTPFTGDGALALDRVEDQAAYLLDHGVTSVFVAGTTGESHSLTVDERRQLAGRWLEVARGTRLRVIIHVGSNSVADAKTLASDAERGGASAIAALAPSYFKPATVDALIATCAEIAGGAPGVPFYYYDVPALTGVILPMAEFLARGRERIPSLAGVKWTNPDLFSYQICLHLAGDFDLPWGSDECLLAALAVGAKGAVGSTYCFAAPIYHRLLKAFADGDLETARAEQFRSVRLVQVLARYGYLGAAKSLMSMLGVDVGPARLPNVTLTREQVSALRAELGDLGFFEWIA